jgi:hypothetical protein
VKNKKAFDALYEWCNCASDFDHFYDGLTCVLNEGEAKRLFAEKCSGVGYLKGMQGQAQEFWDRFRVPKAKQAVLKNRKRKS